MGTSLKSCFSEEEVIVNQRTILGSQMGKWITLAVLVAVFAALLTAGVVRAQEDSATIKYAENGTDPVVTLTATDPEMDTVTWGLSGADAVDFAIDDGVLTFAVGSADTPPDFENGQGSGTDNNTYVVMVTATDTATPNVNEAEFTVTVDVTDEPEDGKVTWTVDADGGGGAADDVMVMQFQVDAILTASVTDGDVSTDLNDDARWQWNRSSSRASTGTPIDGATDNMYTVQTDDVGMYLRATAYYYEGTEPIQKSAYLVSDYQVLAAPEAGNTAPEFDPASVTREVNEGDEGMAVGTRVTATGGHGVLNYTLDGTDGDNEKFEIDQKTGQITTSMDLNYSEDTDEVPEINCGDDNICTVTVLATDSAGRTSADPVTVMITLMDVNEPPTFSSVTPAIGLTTLTLEEGNTALDDTAANATYLAMDPENDNVSLSLMGADRGLFKLSSSASPVVGFSPSGRHPTTRARWTRIGTTCTR